MEDEHFIQEVISLLEQSYDENNWEGVLESIGLLKNKQDDDFNFFFDE